MNRSFRVLTLAVLVNLFVAGSALAQNSQNQPNASDVSDQFKSGANRLGTGFAQVGQGVKQGAILTWNAIVDGATTTASHFKGN